MKEMKLQQGFSRDLIEDKSFKEEHRFDNSSDDVRYLAMQNRILMERLTIAESDIASLKNDYSGLKEDYNSLKASMENCSQSDEEDDIDTNVMIPLNMMSLDMKNKDHGRKL